jgi:acetylornithine deacetylase
MKSGVAAMIAAAAMLAPRWRHGRLIVAVVVDEEYASVGAEALVREWHADAAVVTEPTDLAVGIGHKGFAWIEVETLGHAAHGSRPAEGRDAIARMGRVLTSLERLDRDLQSRPPVVHQGTGSLHASIIAGGRELSSYPDRCTLQFERRTVVDEDGRGALREVDDILARLRGEDPEFAAEARLLSSRPSYLIEEDSRLVRGMCAAMSHAGLTSSVAGLSFWTDAAILAAAGIPSVIFGPGGAGLHGAVEYVNVDDVYVCRDVLVQLATDWVST